MGFKRDRYVRQDMAVHEEDAMDEDPFNMTMRKFLKQVGVTSQQEIERLVREHALTAPAGGVLKVRMVLTAEGTPLNHVVEGEIQLPKTAAV